MAQYEITEAVHVDIRIDGANIIVDYEPGIVDLLPEVANLLTAQGVARIVVEEATTTRAKKPKIEKPTTEPTPEA